MASQSTIASGRASRSWAFSAWCITAAFGTYFCMYAFRKPFTAGTFEGEVLWDLSYKTVLVIAQVFGYALSKLIGVKVISEMPAHRRAAGILVLIGVAHASLLLFALVPPPYNFVMLFFNGLPLGMVFGLVLAYLEGRRVTEALTAGLCASFIVASGCVKSVGRYLVVWGVSEYWMPFWTGAIFLVPLLGFVWMLNQIPPPDDADVAHRGPRAPMTGRQRWRFFAAYAPGLLLLVVTYVLLTVVRTFRDDFAVEIFGELGVHGKPAVFAWTETLVGLAVMAVNGSVFLIRDNRRAMQVAMLMVLGGFAAVGLAATWQALGRLDATLFMILVGLGMYVPYVAFHTTIFERLIAVVRDRGNLGYLMYVADAAGYLSYVPVLLLCHVAQGKVAYLPFFLRSSVLMAVAAIACTIGSLAYFRWKISRRDETTLEEVPKPESAVA